MLPLPSHGLFFWQVRHHVGRPMLHHAVDDVDQAAHHAHQRLLLGLPLVSRGTQGCGAIPPPLTPAPAGWQGYSGY